MRSLGSVGFLSICAIVCALLLAQAAPATAAEPAEAIVITLPADLSAEQAFVQNGIEFASRRVTVDSDDEGAGRAAAAGIAAAG